MSLTAEERQQVIGWLRKYPAGISSSAWGKHELSGINAPRIDECDKATLLECG